MTVGAVSALVWAALVVAMMSLTDSDGHRLFGDGVRVAAAASALIGGFLTGLWATTLWARDRARKAAERRA